LRLIPALNPDKKLEKQGDWHTYLREPCATKYKIPGEDQRGSEGMEDSGMKVEIADGG
jgi:hypothetical protein